MSIDPSKVNLSEKDIEDWLWENPEDIGLHGWLARQFDVPSGRIDLLGFEILTENFKCAVVIEVKNVPIDANALAQVCRYAEDIKKSLETREDFGNDEAYVKKIVIGKGEVSARIMFEADALDIELRTFEVEFTLNVSGSYSWKSETYLAHHQQHKDIGSKNIFDYLVSLPEPEHEEEENKKADE